MRFFWIVLIALCWVAPAQAQKEKVNLNTLIDQFNAVVFIHEHGKNGPEEKPLVKWVKPIIYSPSGTLKKEQAAAFFKLIERIKKLTGHEMRFARKGDKANLIVHFEPRAELEKKVARGINCYGKLGGNKNYEIIRGRAFVPSDRPDKTDHCLVEETVQLFGLVNDSTIIKNSMFHEASTRTSMSVTDQILLKALYDPRLKPGMKRAEAQPILRQVMTDILKKIVQKSKNKT